jgi:hypothetical protein
LQTQARRRTSVWTHREADITTIEHRVSFGSKQKWLSLNGMSALPRRADIVSSVGKVRFVPEGDMSETESGRPLTSLQIGMKNESEVLERPAKRI